MKRDFKKIFIRVILAFMAVALVGAIVSSAYVNSILNNINRVEGEEPTLSQEEIDLILAQTDAPEDLIIPETTEPEVTEIPETLPPETEPEIVEETVEETEPEGKTINILLIGQDRRKNEPRQRSDAMILCSINVQKKTLVFTSFLRDTYVKFPGNYASNRLNVPYVIGGMKMLDNTLKLNFGVEVDHNIEVDFSGFKAVIDHMGGVEIELSQAEADLINKVIVGGDLLKGPNKLTGEQALVYSRIRKLDSDFVRTDRQRKVLNALFQRAKNLSLKNLLSLVNEVAPLITTDMTNEEIIDYIALVFPVLKDLKVSLQRIPADGTFKYDTIDGMSVIVPNYSRNRQILKETIG